MSDCACKCHLPEISDDDKRILARNAIKAAGEYIGAYRSCAWINYDEYAIEQLTIALKWMNLLEKKS